jgi:hypothetical protein
VRKNVAVIVDVVAEIGRHAREKAYCKELSGGPCYALSQFVHKEPSHAPV